MTTDHEDDAAMRAYVRDLFRDPDEETAETEKATGNVSPREGNSNGPRDYQPADMRDFVNRLFNR